MVPMGAHGGAGSEATRHSGRCTGLVASWGMRTQASAVMQAGGPLQANPALWRDTVRLV